MSWKLEDLKYRDTLTRKTLTERTEIANKYLFKKRILHNIEQTSSNGELLADYLSCPIGEMDEEERKVYNRLFYKNETIPERYKTTINEKTYDIRILNIKLIDVIYNYLREENDTLDSDSFDIIPFFSIVDNTDIVSGFFTFERDPKNDHSIVEVGLFSFDVKNKNFGRQIWIDFGECLVDYIARGYTIKFLAYKSNPACRQYDDLNTKLNGYKLDLGRCWEYHFGEKEKK